MKRFSIFLIMVALIAGMVGCAQPAQYNLTISTTEGGEVTTPEDDTLSYDVGTEVPLVALPHTGYRFVNWTGDVDTIANINSASTTITMDGDYSITANFVKQYDLTISSTAGGSVTMPGEGTYACDPGEAVNLVAQAEEGYHFVNWTAQAGTLANATAPQTTFTMPAQNAMVTANFATSYPQIGELFVSALLEGVNFTAPSTGIYRFTITGGAFEVCPSWAAPERPEWWGWRTEILIYENRPIYWSGGVWAPEHPNPADWDLAVGGPQNQPTYEAAEIIGRGMFVDIALAENEYVMLVVNDSKGYFLDNSGGVYFFITVLP
jgi:hypothetical protein